MSDLSDARERWKNGWYSMAEKDGPEPHQRRLLDAVLIAESEVSALTVLQARLRERKAMNFSEPSQYQLGRTDELEGIIRILGGEVT